jgi:alpha/beta superfamily hydrolase
MKTKSILFPSGKLTLEGICHYPDGDGKFPGVVLCHPHPLQGGSLDSSVIHAVASALINESIIAFMFNFRGVGRSQGRFDDGIGERDDVAAAVHWLAAQPEVDNSRIGLAGYSFGAFMTLSEACSDPRIKALALISLVMINKAKIEHLRNCKVPKLLIIGDADQLISSEQLEMVRKDTAEPKQIEIIPGVDHFWASQETVMADKVASFFNTVFK